MKNKLCATIVLYNPDEDIFHNIDSYIDGIDKLIVVDNSELENNLLTEKLKSRYTNIIYIYNGENLGIATALNIACDKAIELNYSWILTMDQDSKFIDFSKFINCFKNILDKESNIGIITPNHTHTDKTTIDDCSYEEKESVITSGNILNLKYFNKIGRYDDTLFIDMVDYDFSNKIVLNNLKIYMIKNIYILHHIGEIFKRKNLISRKIKEKIEHNPQRVYYMTRNRLILSKKYAKSIPKEYNLLKTLNILFIHDITKIILYEDQKLKKLYAKFLALFHFIINKTGRYHL